MLNILHIANDYAGSTVYMNLARELDNLGVRQVIYTPIRDKALIGKNAIHFKNKKSEIIYAPILNWHIDRAFYPYKILKVLRDIQKKVDFSKVDFIHAHTWYSDGGVAYYLAKKYKIPFSIAIRNTDLNLFQKKLVYLRPFGRKILEHSSAIFLISASYLPRVLKLRSLKKNLAHIKGKIKILPNGVAPYWIKNAIKKETTETSTDQINLIYVGRFTSGKNVPLVQQSVIQLNQMKTQKIRMHIVGSGGSESDQVEHIAREHPKYFTYHGKISEKDRLCSLYRSSDIFVMPSSHETFGLVYVEAMLQGLPILYTENEGIDGFYSENIGEKVKEPSVNAIAEKINIMANNLNSYEIPLKKLKANHDWAKIAQKYLEIYEESR